MRLKIGKRHRGHELVLRQVNLANRFHIVFEPIDRLNSKRRMPNLLMNGVIHPLDDLLLHLLEIGQRCLIKLFQGCLHQSQLLLAAHSFGLAMFSLLLSFKELIYLFFKNALHTSQVQNFEVPCEVFSFGSKVLFVAHL